MDTFKIGQRITFRAFTYYSNEKVTRVITGIHDETGWPEVRYQGYSNFLVFPDEIIKSD